MPVFIRKISLVMAGLLLLLKLAGQTSGLLSLPGKIANYAGKPGAPNVLNNGELDASIINQVQSPLLKIVNIVEQSPDFKSPKGFDLRVQLSINKPELEVNPAQQMIRGI